MSKIELIKEVARQRKEIIKLAKRIAWYKSKLKMTKELMDSYFNS